MEEYASSIPEQFVKTVWLVEGKHDRLFLENVFVNLGVDITKVHWFDQKRTAILPEKKHAETVCLNGFLSRKQNYKHTLVKSEGSKGDVINEFPNVKAATLNRGSRIILFVDFGDHGDNYFLSLINGELSDRRESVFVEKSDNNCEKGILITYLEAAVKWKNDNSIAGNISIVAFESDLEKAAFINDDDTPSAIDTKLSSLAKNESVCEAFKKVLGLP